MVHVQTFQAQQRLERLEQEDSRHEQERKARQKDQQQTSDGDYILVEVRLFPVVKAVYIVVLVCTKSGTRDQATKLDVRPAITSA